MIKELVKDEAILSQVCTPATTDDAPARASWSSLMGKKPNAAARPLPPAPKLNRALRGGLGPNKASGHKGGISRQGSKRG